MVVSGSEGGRERRRVLTTELVLRKAVDLADEAGLDGLSMRKLGQALGVEAMSLYNHVANKGELLDGIGDLVVAEIEIPASDLEWREATRQRAVSAHAVFLRHPWVTTLIESQTNLSPPRLRYFDSVIGTFRRAGFSIGLAYNAFLTLDSYLYGFTQHEVTWPHEPENRPELIEEMLPQLSSGSYPYVGEMMGYVADLGGGSGKSGYEEEFEFGLELILDGLERRLEREQARSAGGAG